MDTKLIFNLMKELSTEDQDKFIESNFERGLQFFKQHPELLIKYLKRMDLSLAVVILNSIPDEYKDLRDMAAKEFDEHNKLEE